MSLLHRKRNTIYRWKYNYFSAFVKNTLRISVDSNNKGLFLNRLTGQQWIGCGFVLHHSSKIKAKSLPDLSESLPFSWSNLASPHVVHEGSSCSISFPSLVFNFSFSNECVVVHRHGFNLHFLSDQWMMSNNFSWTCSFAKHVHIFFIWSSSYYWFVTLYIFWIQGLCHMYVLQICSLLWLVISSY